MLDPLSARRARSVLYPSDETFTGADPSRGTPFEGDQSSARRRRDDHHVGRCQPEGASTNSPPTHIGKALRPKQSSQLVLPWKVPGARDAQVDYRLADKSPRRHNSEGDDAAGLENSSELLDGGSLIEKVKGV